MAGEPKPWTKRIFELLADGEWHDREELILWAGDLVPAARASRKAEALRARQRVKRGQPPAPRAKWADDQDRIVATGRREIVNDTLWTLTQSKRLERTPVGEPNIRFRLGRCTCCGQVLAYAPTPTLATG